MDERTRAGMRSLLELLRGRHPQGRLDDAEWAAVLKVAEEENVLPFAAERLRALDDECTQAHIERLDEIHRKARLSNFVWTESLKSILMAFHHAGLPVIALKGPCLAERLYSDATLRTCYDLDLLVRQSDLARAEQLLIDLGFSPNSHGDDYHRPWSRNALNLELHHNVENPLAFGFDLDTAWARARCAQFHLAPVWLLAPADELLYLCLHAVRHRFDRLSLILDLTLAFRGLANELAGLPELPMPGFENVLALGWMMAARLDLKIQEPGWIHLGDHRRLEELADRLWQEHMVEQSKTLDWAAQHRFYLELEPPGWRRILRRWRHIRILLTRVIDADIAFAERFHLHRSWQVRLLRPIRLLTKPRPGPA